MNSKIMRAGSRFRRSPAMESAPVNLTTTTAFRRSAGRAGAVLLLLAGCGGAPPRAHSVAIRGFQYLPATLTVAKGDTVVWSNEDIVPHTATAREQRLDTRTIESRQSARFTATQSGSYTYICAFHPSMKGTLIVR